MAVDVARPPAPKRPLKDVLRDEMAALSPGNIGRDTAHAYLTKYITMAQASKKEETQQSSEMMALMVSSSRPF